VAIDTPGLDQFTDLARKARAMSRDLERNLIKELADATEPLQRDIRRSAVETLPARGGLNRRAASLRFNLRLRQRGLRLEAAAGPRGIRRMDELNRGQLRHPVWGNVRVWVRQQILPGWWDRPVQAGDARLRRAAEETLERFARRLTG